MTTKVLALSHVYRAAALLRKFSEKLEKKDDLHKLKNLLNDGCLIQIRNSLQVNK